MKLTSAIIALGMFAASAYPQTVKKLKVLTASETDPGRLLPPPAEDGSESQKRELAEVTRIVTSRTEERYSQAKWDNEHEDVTAFAATIGAGFDMAKLPATAKLLALVLNDQSVAASASKVYFHRRFPVAAAGIGEDAYRKWSCDADVKRPVDRPLRSYPSGHATMGYSLGVFLAGLMPDRAQAILTRAADYANSREICGDHYPSDIEASHALGNSLAILLLNNSTLKPMIEESRAELRAAHLTK